MTIKNKIQGTRNSINWFLLLRLAGIVLFIVVLTRTDLGELWGWMKQVDGRFILLALFFQVLLLLFKGLRWWLLNEDAGSKRIVFQRFGEFLEAYAIGVITPGRVGELLKAGHASGRSEVISKGLLVIAERGLDLSFFFIVAGLSPLLGYLGKVSPGIGWLMLVTGITGIMIAFLILMLPGLVIFVENLLKKIRIIKGGQSLTIVPRRKDTLFSFGVLSLLSNACAFISFYFIALSVALKLDFITISGGVAYAGVINTIPVTIMGLGTRDVTLLYIFSEISSSQILAFSGMILMVSQIGGGLFSLLLGQFFLLKSKTRQRFNHQE